MNDKLIIVESPNKIKTIQSFLGDGYNIIATYGHFRELNKKRGYDPQTFEPIWQIIDDKNSKTSKENVIKEIKNAAKKASEIYIATDPDREGESIAWHVFDILDKENQKKCERITFNEITKKAILESLKHPRAIDMNLVHSQFARRILDRIIGYKLSNFTKKSLNAVSAGRVQSVALLFVVERLLERLNFVPSNWYEIYGNLENGIRLSYIGSKCKFEKYDDGSSSSHVFRFANKDDALTIYNDLSKNFILTKISEPKLTKGDSLKPITTDKLLQMASSSFGWNASKTTFVAQKMFEGIDVDNQHIGLISYPRTDSERLSDDFCDETFAFITQKYGSEYVNTQHAKNINKKANIQDAHEAIRPTDINLMPHKIKNLVDESIYKLYSLIWYRTISSLMVAPSFLKHELEFENNGHDFYYSYKQIYFKGYYVLDYYAKALEEYEKPVPTLSLNQTYIGEPILEQKEKTPPPFYTEATLIAALKDSGVGRPSTYSKMASIGDERGYTFKEQNKLIPTDLGVDVIKVLNKDFSNIITPKFTANMEDELDKIANGKLDWQTYLQDFTPSFLEKVKESYKNLPKLESEPTGKICPKCNKNELLIRTSKVGSKFIACSGFPSCKYTESIENEDGINENCPECNHPLVVKINKKKQKFIACSNFPNCKYVRGIEK